MIMIKLKVKGIENIIEILKLKITELKERNLQRIEFGIEERN